MKLALILSAALLMVPPLTSSESVYDNNCALDAAHLVDEHDPARPYFRKTPAQLSRGYGDPHVWVTGKIELVKYQSDGDRHFQLHDFKHPDKFIVAECIPMLPCDDIQARAGDCLSVKGIARFDPKHGWYEVHPVEWAEEILCAS